jgi:hypothetical protein
MKTGIVELDETAVARQRLGKHVRVLMHTHAATELMDAVLSMRSVPYQILYIYIVKGKKFLFSLSLLSLPARYISNSCLD